ncbi:hypothetical protein NDU88_000223 [Pleurodeles waltl]|uniref:Uncharacterized protein n=1 Tax=Pleurodeles waltl TaxID=8319 RepID=A0AAV7LE10_PLEWA|nr:hypothetical protein NDU88_000223 [Pleurodeles waltl]
MELGQCVDDETHGQWFSDRVRMPLDLGAQTLSGLCDSRTVVPLDTGWRQDSGSGRDMKKVVRRGTDLQESDRQYAASTGQSGDSNGQYAASDGQCGDSDGQYAASTGQCGDSDGQYAASPGQCGDSDGQYAASDGQCGDSDGQYAASTGQSGDSDGQYAASTGQCGDSDGQYAASTFGREIISSPRALVCAPGPGAHIRHLH